MNQEDSLRKMIRGRAIPLPGNDIDTDQIIPARYLKFVTFENLGKHVFQDERFDENGGRKNHPFNDERYQGASILLVNENFGCGSSREHAPQSLMRAGIRAVIGESYGEIFAGNCTALGIPNVRLAHEEIDTLMNLVSGNPQTEIELDLESRTVRAAVLSFSIVIPESYRQSLVTGAWDTTALLLANRELIEKKMSELPYIAGY